MKKFIRFALTAFIFTLSLWVAPPVEAQENNNGLLFGISTTTYWEDNVEKVALTQPSLVDGVTYIPLRIASEYLGKDVLWNATDSSATITDKDTGNWIKFSQNTNIASTNHGNITMQRKPFIENDSYMVPLRIFSEYFKASVYWHQNTQGILVTKAPTESEQQNYEGLLMKIDDQGYFDNGFGITGLTKPVVFNGTSYLPLRVVSEYLGAKVTWNQAEGSATLTMTETEKHITFDQRYAYAVTNNGNINMERAPFIQDDCYMVPARIITEFFGCSIYWNQELKSFLVTKTAISESEKEVKFGLMEARFYYIKVLENYRKADSPYTRVINRTYPIPPNYVGGSGKLSDVKGVQMESNAAAALNQMLNGLKAAGMSVQVNSGYRTDAKQQDLYNRQISRQGGNKYKAGTISALPYTSEHQAGLAVDVSTNGVLNDGFASTAQGKWLAAHCSEYGFIVRYTQPKQKITGIIFEPWHFRYVGSPEMAKAITNSGLCMEEYFNKYLAEKDLTPYLPYL